MRMSFVMILTFLMRVSGWCLIGRHLAVTKTIMACLFTAMLRLWMVTSDCSYFNLKLLMAMFDHLVEKSLPVNPSGMVLTNLGCEPAQQVLLHMVRENL